MKLKAILTTAIVGMALAVPSVSSAAPFVYVVNRDTDDVSQYDASMGGLLMVWTIRDGNVRQIEYFRHRAEALEAAGLKK